jgi:magnesium transporter
MATAAGSTSTSSPDDLEGIRKAVLSAEGGEFVSVGLHEPDEAEMARVAEILGLHRLAVEDSLT